MSNLLDIKAGAVATNNGEGSHVSQIGERGSRYVCSSGPTGRPVGREEKMYRNDRGAVSCLQEFANGISGFARGQDG